MDKIIWLVVGFAAGYWFATRQAGAVQFVAPAAHPTPALMDLRAQTQPAGQIDFTPYRAV